MSTAFSTAGRIRLAAKFPAFQALAVKALILLAFIAASNAATTATSSAGEALESAKGGLFHRKGWVSPSIYRKTKKAEAKKTASATPRTAAGSSKRKSTSKPRRKGRNNARRTAKQRRAANRRRIPSRIIKRREAKLNKAARRSKNSKNSKKNSRVASLGSSPVAVPKSEKQKPKRSITGGGARIKWAASSRCLPARLRKAINYVARNFGRVRVTSTCRSRRRNRRVGGASNSWHLKGRAADLRVFGNIGKAARYLRGVAGGYKHYGGGLFHIDTGPKRSW